MTNNELLSCLTRFCLVIKPTSFPQPVLNAWTISRLIKYQPKSNEKYMPFLHWMEFQVLKVILVKTWKIQPPDLLFLVVFIRRSFYISRYHFSKIFRTSFNIIWKIDFQHEFSIFNKLTQCPFSAPPHPLNSQNVLSMTKAFCWCSLTTSPQPLLILKTATGGSISPPLWFFEKRIF